ncbi:MAG: DUF1810 domain-containing protein [Candidatus Cyclonatronum sp.]|uniref:DUF1810 domain-containing protein n=1 Tax=Cyclonatronum sp. TaxID=3024185 RepID=UPI0025BD5F79|nr:DUF1810 domain-containing protein [Cyclonatronum sp.]MCC5933030.1 DUF1810 domain-containing protein [Balneolales bacterium]MCH8485703.1 DUF1810 domain-containing protein [Cyclonatronum sp.]
MTTDTHLQKFIDAQQHTYGEALTEIRSGKKRTHWMWFIFPQFRGLGFSTTSQFYAIQSVEEARAYLSHPVLGFRLREITAALLDLDEKNARNIFGSPDDLKLKSCMTLFSVADDSGDTLFTDVIHQYFTGSPDKKTLQLLNQRN